MATYEELVNRAKDRVTEVGPSEVRNRLDELTVLDVREADEYDQGAVPGAKFIPRGVLERDIAMLVPDLNTPIVVYCSGGSR